MQFRVHVYQPEEQQNECDCYLPISETNKWVGPCICKLHARRSRTDPAEDQRWTLHTHYLWGSSYLQNTLYHAPVITMQIKMRHVTHFLTQTLIEHNNLLNLYILCIFLHVHFQTFFSIWLTWHFSYIERSSIDRLAF